MGILPALDSRPLLVLPDTPPELVSPGASSYSSRSSLSVDRAWNSPPSTSNRTPPSPSMSNYEKPSTADMMPADQIVEVGKSRTDSTLQNVARQQQLPSLSSLFGPPTARPLNSPPSDRLGAYPATSPLDHPRVTSTDRAHPAASYFPPTLSPPVSQPRSTYESKFDSDRLLSRSLSGPGSPRYQHESDHVRPRADSSAGKWPMQQDTNRHEYSLTSRDNAYRSPQSHFRLQFPGSEDHATPNYTDQRSSQGGPHPPPTPTSTIVSEGIPSKDGLGPKIWTGTHFLPRFVRAAEVPGEGMCYFYDDGSHCKSVIDGEAVNAHWGVTKAGKPRKRLAIACVTCREKKIKCDPDYPRCVQCEKFGRICKFKNAPRGGHNTSPSTPPAELTDVRKLVGPPRPGDVRLSECDSSSSVSPRTTLRQHSPEAGPHKRLRVGYDNYISVGDTHVQASQATQTVKSSSMPKPQMAELPRIPDDLLDSAWRRNPYLSDPHSTSNVISHFFLHLDSTPVMQFVPEEAFKAWVASPTPTKTPEDLMLLYSILAVGMALSRGSKSNAFDYAQVAQYAQRTVTHDCLQLAQCRMLLALYYLSIARRREANELLTAAIATTASLQLNLELDQSREGELAAYPLGMTKAAYCESRRRTFWSLFVLERLNGMFPDRLAMINAEEIYVRIPSDSQSFEQQVEAHLPFFNPYASNVTATAATEESPEISTYLIEMVHMWSSNASRIYRMGRRAGSSEMDHVSAQSIINKLQDWHTSLPNHLVFSASNLETAVLAGNVGSYLTMHLLYNHALIKLNRYRYDASRSSAVARSTQVQNCFKHATIVFEIVQALDRLLRCGNSVVSALPLMLAAVVTEAVDVLSATGRLSQLGTVIEELRTAKLVVEATCGVWEDSCPARNAIDERIETLTRIRIRRAQPESPEDGYRLVTEGHRDDKYRCWQITKSMEPFYLKDMDIIYASAP